MHPSDLIILWNENKRVIVSLTLGERGLTEFLNHSFLFEEKVFDRPRILVGNLTPYSK